MADRQSIFKVRHSQHKLHNEIAYVRPDLPPLPLLLANLHLVEDGREMFCISNCILIAFQPEMPLDIIRLAAFVVGQQIISICEWPRPPKCASLPTAYCDSLEHNCQPHVNQLCHWFRLLQLTDGLGPVPDRQTDWGRVECPVPGVPECQSASGWTMHWRTVQIMHTASAVGPIAVAVKFVIS